MVYNGLIILLVLNFFDSNFDIEQLLRNASRHRRFTCIECGNRISYYRGITQRPYYRYKDLNEYKYSKLEHRYSDEYLTALKTIDSWFDT